MQNWEGKIFSNRQSGMGV